MSVDVVISIVMVCFMGLGFIIGNLYGRGMQWSSYRKLKKSWEKDIELWRSLYLTAERQRQEIIVWVCETNKWKLPKFDSPFQSEIDFPEESPILKD